MDRTQKEETVASMRQLLDGASLVVVTHYSGLTVPQMETLRQQMRAAGAGFKVTKNRLTRLALKDTRFEGMADLFTGPTGIAYSADPVAAAKVAVDFAKTNPKLVLVGGGLGEKLLDVDGVKSLATLPSIDELRAKIVGIISTPATRIAGVLQAPAGQLARVLKARAEQGDAA